jgi:hypothetical protein
MGLVPPDLALPMRLHGNDSSLAPGETLTLTLTIMPESILMVVDCYVALQLPNLRVWFLHIDGSFTPEIQSYVRQWSVVPFRAELFHYTFTGSEPPGNYQWLAICTEPGTGTILGATAQAPFTFSP